MATLVQVGPAQDFMRAVNSPLGANTNTCPSGACATNSRPAWAIVKPSGPLAPKVGQKRPTLATLPSLPQSQHQPVGRDAGIDQATEPPARQTPKNPPRRIVQAGLPLVGKIDLAIGGDVQVVAALEGLRIARRQQRLNPPRPHVELHDAVHIIG